MSDELAVAGPLPWDTLYPRQVQLFNTGLAADCQEHLDFPPCVLCDGPRKSTKSVGVAHRVIRHMWDTPDARVGLLVKTTGSATDGGIWCDLMDIALPVWFNSGLNCEFTSIDRTGSPGSKTAAKTRTIFFRIRNAFGGESELRLIPIKHEDIIEERLKSGRFSCIWVSEVSNFSDSRIFFTAWEQLRMWNLDAWRHMWIGDTNPSEEGEDSWIYKLFIKKEVDAKLQEKTGGAAFLKSLRRMEFKLTDNIGMNEAVKEGRELLYSDNEGRLERDFHGRWVKGQGRRGKHFAGVFVPSIHVVGGDRSTIALDKDTTELFTGWDIGEVNHSAGIIERRYVKSEDGQTEWSVWSILDAFLHLGEQVRVWDLGKEMLSMMDELESVYQKKFEWTHYADDTAVHTWRPTSGSFDYQEIRAATGDRIELVGVPKPANSLYGRVKLVKRLLMENRLFVSGKCQEVIDMFLNLRKGKSKSDFVIWESFKHVFDWVSYILWMECHDEMDTINDALLDRGDGDYVSLPLKR